MKSDQQEHPLLGPEQESVLHHLLSVRFQKGYWSSLIVWFQTIYFVQKTSYHTIHRIRTLGKIDRDKESAIGQLRAENIQSGTYIHKIKLLYNNTCTMQYLFKHKTGPKSSGMSLL